MDPAAAHIIAPYVEKHLAPRGSNEEQVHVSSTDPDNRTFAVIATQNHAAGERICRTT